MWTTRRKGNSRSDSIWAMMMPRVFACVTFGLVLASVAAQAQSARDYYNELYKAGGLDRMADEYVCFDDSKDLDTFFIFGKSDTLREFLEEQHGISKLSKNQQDLLKRGFLTVRGYDKGVPLSSEETYDKDDATWVTDTFLVQKTRMRMRLSIAWETLRYKRTLEILNPDGTLKTPVDRYGRCEVIPPDVRQKAN